MAHLLRKRFVIIGIWEPRDVHNLAVGLAIERLCIDPRSAVASEYEANVFSHAHRNFLGRLARSRGLGFNLALHVT
jgi:hypothetical protein